MTEKEISDCSDYVAKADLQASGGRKRSIRRVRSERAIVRHALAGLEAGKRGLRLRLSTLRGSRAEVGFDIAT